MIITTWSAPAAAKVRFGIGLRLGGGPPRAGVGFRGWPEPIWDTDALERIIRQWQRERDQAWERAEQRGEHLVTAPLTEFPGWSRCQDLALRYRFDMALVRCNLAALNAALAILHGRRRHEIADSIGSDYPDGFDAEDWGREILRDIGWRGDPERVRRLLGRARDRMRELFTDTRDAIMRDVVADHHRWERARLAGDPKAVNAAAWRLWITLGEPRTR